MSCTTASCSTPRGQAVALEVLRHHRLLELFLVEQLGVPWEEVHAEAEPAPAPHLRGARGADRGKARPAVARSARRPDPRARRLDDPHPGAAARGLRRRLAGPDHARLRPLDAAPAVPRRARSPTRGRARGRERGRARRRDDDRGRRHRGTRCRWASPARSWSRPSRARAVRLLILGGTVFLGRAVVADARTRGHDVTIFHRGTHPAPPGVTDLRGDRSNGDLAAIATWTPGRGRRHVRPRAADRRGLGGAARAADRPLLLRPVVSSSTRRNPGRSTSRRRSRRSRSTTVEDIGEGRYGALKALSETAAADATGGRALGVRPGLIVGPHDPTGRFDRTGRTGSPGAATSSSSTVPTGPSSSSTSATSPRGSSAPARRA